MVFIFTPKLYDMYVRYVKTVKTWYSSLRGGEPFFDGIMGEKKRFGNGQRSVQRKTNKQKEKKKRKKASQAPF